MTFKGRSSMKRSKQLYKIGLRPVEEQVEIVYKNVADKAVDKAVDKEEDDKSNKKEVIENG